MVLILKESVTLVQRKRLICTGNYSTTAVNKVVPTLMAPPSVLLLSWLEEYTEMHVWAEGEQSPWEALIPKPQVISYLHISQACSLGQIA